MKQAAQQRTLCAAGGFTVIQAPGARTAENRVRIGYGIRSGGGQVMPIDAYTLIALANAIIDVSGEIVPDVPAAEAARLFPEPERKEKPLCW